MARDVVSAYTLILGDEYGPAERRRVLHRGGGMEGPGPRGPGEMQAAAAAAADVDPEATGRLADAWRAGNPEQRFWQIL